MLDLLRGYNFKLGGCQVQREGNKIAGSANILNGFLWYGRLSDCANISQSFSWFKSAFIWDSCCIYHDHIHLEHQIEKLPIAALVGVMVMVAIGTFEWISFRIINKMPKHDIFVGILVAIITIMLQIGFSCLIGVIISALVCLGERCIRAKKI
jgi:SulP family sulfate permease